MAQGTDDGIYIGVFLLAIFLTMVIGVFSGRLKTAILLALWLRGLLIVLILAV